MRYAFHKNTYLGGLNAIALGYFRLLPRAMIERCTPIATRLSKSSILYGIAAASLLLIGCADQGEQTAQAPSDSPQDVIALKVGYIPLSDCAHLYVAIEKGYFSEQGLNVELVPMQGGATILPAVKSGDLDIGFTNVVSVILFNSAETAGSPDWLKCISVASYEREGNTTHALVVRADSDLTPQDLSRPGMRIAVNTRGNIEELMLRRYLDSIGVPQTNLELVPLAFPEMVGALERRDVHAASICEPFIRPPIADGKTKLLAYQYLEVKPQTLVATYAATTNWLEQNREAYVRFDRAFAQADAFLNDNPEESREIIGKATRLDPSALSLIEIPYFMNRVDPDDFAETAEQMHRFGFIPEQIETAQMLLSE